MKRMLKDWAVALTLGIAVFLGIQLLQPKPQIPDIAPDFSVKTLQGETIALSALKGRTVVLNFWATWCGPCKQEAPAFSAFASAHPEIPVLGLSVDDGPKARVQRTVREWNMNYPVAIIKPALQAKYDVSILPTTVVIGPEGKVKNVHVGIMSESQLARAVR